jgi:hypothetical protein
MILLIILHANSNLRKPHRNSCEQVDLLCRLGSVLWLMLTATAITARSSSTVPQMHTTLIAHTNALLSCSAAQLTASTCYPSQSTSQRLLRRWLNC